ncbi:RagB/SusD family nutrient uptake outer membrane protein [Sphingobacterium sp. UT-1RO-CII-1]|uniref:RagB/SusD family nutrient uptake outer membrane protein n=1 Tax=Sphingobacterium sp. UT-1RO-CII-1 TaxID=2995225 RepID=UPI00227B5864|nr:RagB/SusD family nutrient uptake outer membrane protein [Sphingobacterium sp. UT-1RO-CII-1]MCY4778427.1 RagB/SusD family nutrient uptake outer membrane protein [Sphingobacterium sp. UT-1RO-CII-1]
MKFLINKYTIAAVLGLSLTGCSKDFLDKINPNKPVEAVFWANENDAVSAVATVYSPIRSQMYGYYAAYTGYQTMNRADDTFFLIGEEAFTWDYVNFRNSASTAESDFGRLYRGINRANVFFKNIDKVPMDETKKKQLISEVSFLRGMYYFLLAANYGDVPLRLTVATDDAEPGEAVSAPEAEIWKQVIVDFKVAKENLPVDRPDSESGRVTKGAAIAYLGKALVYTKQYGEAETELKALLSSPYNYDLVADYQDNFKHTTKFNKESVWELAYDGTLSSGGVWGDDQSNSHLGMVLPNFIGPDGTGAWFKIMPSPAIIRDFISEERPAGSDTRFDKRMNASFLWKYSDYQTGATDGKWYGNQTFDDIWAACQEKLKRHPAEELEFGFPTIDGKQGRFLMNKYTNAYMNAAGSNSHYDPAKNNNNNLRVFRFSEVLLLHAEACAQNGNTADAASSLKRIRDRAGLASKTWSGKDDLMKEIMKQNELEFFFEGHRFFDLKRWYAHAEMKKIFVDNKKQGANNFEPKHYYLPIPQDEMNTNTKIEQHPLWR